MSQKASTLPKPCASTGATLVKVTRKSSSTRSTRRSMRRSGSTKDPVEVYCRLRTLGNPEKERSCIETISETLLQVNPPMIGSLSKNAVRTATQHTFKRVFSQVTGQKEIYDEVALPLVHDLLRGKNGLLFTYGITNSGKTYTITGPPEDCGILPRSLDVLFNSISELLAKPYIFRPDKSNGFDVHTEAEAKATLELIKKCKFKKKSKNKISTDHSDNVETSSTSPDTSRIPDLSLVQGIDEDSSYGVFISYFEIYNNYVYDLLDEIPEGGYQSILGLKSHKGPQPKTLREDPRKLMYVGNAIEVEVRSANEAFALIAKGQKTRKYAQTQLNTTSSRSHVIFSIRLVQAPLDAKGEEVLQDKSKIKVSQLSLVDLAGSERTSRTKAGGIQLREAGSINSSLMVLRNCIEALRDNQTSGANKIVPYRDSKITHLFKNFFDGEGKVRMIVCMNPRSDDYEESIHVLKFSEVTQTVTIERSDSVKIPDGMSSGRRRANMLFKETLKHLEEEQASLPVEPELKSDVRMINLGSSHPFSVVMPPLKLDLEKYLMRELTFQEFVKALQERNLIRVKLKEELSRKQQAFRERLISLEEDYEHIKSELSYSTAELAGKNQEINLLQEKCKKLQKKNEHLQSLTDACLQSNIELKTELEKSQNRITQEKDKRKHLKLTMHEIISFERAKFESQLRSEVAQTEEDLLNVIRSQEDTFDELRHLVVQVQDDSLSESDAMSEHFTPKLSSRPSNISLSQYNSNYIKSNRQIKEPTRQDHKSTSMLPQPLPLHAKKQKPALPAKSKDLRSPRIEKYILAHQEPANDGNMLTHLYTGDVTRTPGGGTAVQFTDVETLSPIQNKKLREMPHALKSPIAIGSKPTNIPKLCIKTKSIVVCDSKLAISSNIHMPK